MSTYSVLTGLRTVEGSIKNWVNRSNTPSTTILTEAQALLYQELRTREMVQVATGTLAIAADTISLTTVAPRFRAPRLFMFTANGTAAKYKPKYRMLDEVLDAWEYDSTGARVSGSPEKWALEGDNIQFDKPTDIARPYRFTYYGALAPLSVSNETNFLTERYPRLLRSACLAMVAEFDKDQTERNHWMAAAMDEISRANVQSDLELEGVETVYDYEAT